MHKVGFIYKIYEDCWLGSGYEKKNPSSSAEHPQCFCGPPSLLFNALFGSFLRVRAGCREADHSPPSRAEVKNAWKYSSTVIVAYLHGVLLKQTGDRIFLPFSALWVRGNWKIVFAI